MGAIVHITSKSSFLLDWIIRLFKELNCFHFWWHNCPIQQVAKDRNPVFFQRPLVFSCWILFKGTFRDHKSEILHFGNGIRCMNLTLKGIVKIYPRLITKRHYILSLKKITSDFFQTDNQPTVCTTVNSRCTTLTLIIRHGSGKSTNRIIK